MSAQGTFTFLFTDIEGSTLLWEQRGAEMRTALESHDRVLREAIGSARGRVVKTTGDGMLAVFDGATDAICASIAAQRALQGRDGSTMPLKVRMGLHTGIADLRDGDYWGTSVNRTARIMAAAHGEQILLSAATAELARNTLADGIALRDLGEHRLKGLINPEQLLQVLAPGLRTDFPPLATQAAHSLLAERDAFVGRSDALDDLQRRFNGGARMVSVLGIGGTGKTRLVTRFGWTALPAFAGGVWFCDLAPARGADGVVHAVAQGLGVPLGTDDPVVQLGHAIDARGACLVILDNFEQVARHADETLGQWLDRARNARFLVTTREVLGLPGEETLALAPLASRDAVELFMRRAEAAKPGFAPTADDAAAIAPLVRLLDGLPLAIELAAARVRVMPPRTLLARMTERFKLLATSGGRVDRQATLRAVFDWSWDLLSMPEKAALAQLSVFEGGFTLEAVEGVLDLSQYDAAPWPVDVLQSLVQKSLVRSLSDDRFDLLVSVQEYAAEHLRTPSRYEGSGEAARRAAEARHAAWFAGLDEESAAANGAIEIDNLVAACRRAAARGDAETASRALEHAWTCLRLRGPFQAAVDLAGCVTGDDAVAARVNLVAGQALRLCGRTPDAHTRLEAARASARSAGASHLECRALLELGFLAAYEGDLDAMRADLAAALAIADGLADRRLQGSAHSGLGHLNAMAGRPAEARAHYEQSVRRVREAGDRRLEGAVTGNLAMLYVGMGLLDQARGQYQASLELAREVGDRRVESNTLCNLGLLQFLEGQLAEAEQNFEAALSMARDIGNGGLEIIVLCNLGMVRERVNDLASAQAHLERGLAIARERGHKRSEGQILGHLGLVHARCGAFAEARRCVDAGEALLQAVSDQESLGIIRALRAEAEQLAGDATAAASALAAAERIAAELSPGAASELGYALERARRCVTPR